MTRNNSPACPYNKTLIYPQLIPLLLIVASFIIISFQMKTDPSIEPNPGPCRRSSLNQLDPVTMTLLEYQVTVNNITIANNWD